MKLQMAADFFLFIFIPIYRDI